MEILQNFLTVRNWASVMWAPPFFLIQLAMKLREHHNLNMGCQGVDLPLLFGFHT